MATETRSDAMQGPAFDATELVRAPFEVAP